jgi:hypothetical protein
MKPVAKQIECLPAGPVDTAQERSQGAGAILQLKSHS